MNSGRSSSLSNRTASSVRYNPITGEETVYQVSKQQQQQQQSRPPTRPKGVPPLPLGREAEFPASGRDLRYTPARPQSPGHASSVSWGLGSDADVLSVRSNDVGGGRTPAPKGVPQLPVRQPQPAARNAVTRGVKAGGFYDDEDDVRSTTSTKSCRTASSSSSRLSARSPDSPTFDESASTTSSSFRSLSLSHRPPASEADMHEASEKIEEFERLWVSRNQKNANEVLRRINKEEELEARRRESILDAVMVDQLSRAPMCDPEQETSRSDVSVQQSLKHVPGMPRGAIRHLHHSKIRTANSATEQLLSDRVRFTARLLSASACQDVIRELTGFFFALDSSFTVYEFKNFGKTSKALPFIKRGHYSSAWGRSRSRPYTIFDIFVGNTLCISSEDQPSLPDTARACPVLRLRVSEVDDANRKQIIETMYMSGQQLSGSQYARLHAPSDPEELEAFVRLEQLQRRVRSGIRRRAVATVTGLFAHCRRVDDEGRDQLPRHELELALKKFRVPQLSDDDLDRVWEACDPHMTSFADFSQYLLALFGEMPEPVKRLVLKAFLKMDTAKKGIVSFGDISRFYRATSHPAAAQGEAATAQVLKNFLEGFANFVKRKETVTSIEFLFFYEGLGIQLDDDATLAEIVRNCWNV